MLDDVWKRLSGIAECGRYISCINQDITTFYLTLPKQSCALFSSLCVSGRQ